MHRISIFVIYYKPEQPRIASEVFRPLMAGACGQPLPPGFIGDDSGKQISERNRIYGEHTAHYWVLHNYLPQSSEEYVGFCHYRRFLDFSAEDQLLDLPQSIPFDRVYAPYFLELAFRHWNETSVLRRIGEYDVILPRIGYTGHDATSVRTHFNYWHRAAELQRAEAVLKRLFPAYLPQAQEVLNGITFYSCNCFTMRRQLLSDYLHWMFELLAELDQGSGWEHYTRYYDVRMPAFIMERFFTIWLRHQAAVQPLKVLELPSYLLDFGTDLSAQAIFKRGLILMRHPSPQVQQVVRDAFLRMPLESRVFCCIKELRLNPRHPEVLALLHSEPGQTTFKMVLSQLHAEQPLPSPPP